MAGLEMRVASGNWTVSLGAEPQPSSGDWQWCCLCSRALGSLASDSIHHLYGAGSKMKQEDWLKLQRPHGLSWPLLQWPFPISSRQLWIGKTGVSEVWAPRFLT